MACASSARRSAEPGASSRRSRRPVARLPTPDAAPRGRYGTTAGAPRHSRSEAARTITRLESAGEPACRRGRPASRYRRAMRLIVARCEVSYVGRLSTALPEAVRLLMIKPDGTFMVWADGGGPNVKPLNWMTPPTVIEEQRDEQRRAWSGSSCASSARGAPGDRDRRGALRRRARARHAGCAREGGRRARAAGAARGRARSGAARACGWSGASGRPTSARSI